MFISERYEASVSLAAGVHGFAAADSYPRKSRSTSKNPTRIIGLGFVAEKQGFEPWLRFSRTTPLAGEPLRPLGYFSATALKRPIIIAYAIIFVKNICA